MEALNRLYELYKVRQNFQFISITFENLKQLSRIWGEYKIKYPLVSTTQDSCYYLNFKSGFPATIITGKDGKVAYFTFGGASEKEKANTYFKNMIYPKLDSLLR